jgi:hypothetical protein
MSLFRSHAYGEPDFFASSLMGRLHARDAATIAADWAQRLGASTQKISDGVDAVRVSPGTAAAAQADVWANNTVAAKEKFRKNTAAVSLGEWQEAMKTKGVQRIATGATAAQGKMEAFMGKLLPYQAAAKARIPARGNFQQNVQRMVAWVTEMSKFSAH